MVRKNLDGCKAILILDDADKSQKINGKLVAMMEEEKCAILNIDADELDEKSMVKDRPLILNLINEEKGVYFYKGRAAYYLKGRLHVEKLEFIELVQRRKDVKVGIKKEGYIEVFVKDEKDERYNQTVEVPVEYRDISAGGVGFYIKGEKNPYIQVGDIIKAWITFLRDPIYLEMKILREIKEEKDLYSYGCSFTKIMIDEESIIREFVFRTQLGLRKKMAMEEDDIFI